MNVKPKTKYRFLLQKKTAWIFLTLLFAFDSVVSYWAVLYMHGKEADLLIAPLVEKYPILYFPIIPVLMIIMFIIVKIITKVFAIILKRRGFTDRNIPERIILSATVLYWIIGNSSDNLIFLLGFRISDIWLKTTLFAMPITLYYVLYMLSQIQKS